MRREMICSIRRDLLVRVDDATQAIGQHDPGAEQPGAPEDGPSADSRHGPSPRGRDTKVNVIVFSRPDVVKHPAFRSRTFALFDLALVHASRAGSAELRSRRAVAREWRGSGELG
jgi:hypothetical protein